MAGRNKSRAAESQSREVAKAGRRDAAVTGTKNSQEPVPQLRIPLIPGSSSAGRRLRRLRRTIIAACLALALLAPVVMWLSFHSNNVTSANATVQAHLAEIGTRVTGLVRAVDVDAGDRVVAGQVLVRLEDGHLRADVREAKAQLAGLELSLEAERSELANQRQQAEQQSQAANAKVQAAMAQAQAAEIRAAEAGRVHSLQSSLFADGGAISGEEVKNAESAKRAADAELNESRARVTAERAASENVRLTNDALSIREQRIAVLEADVERARARVQRAEAELEAALIRAPEDGAIVRRFVQAGGSIEAGQPIISMWLGNDVWVEAWIDENDIGSVRIGSSATVTLQAFPDQEFAGTVDKIGLVTDYELPDSDVPQPRFARMRGAPVVGVRVRLVEPPEDLLPGLSASVAIERTAR